VLLARSIVQVVTSPGDGSRCVGCQSRSARPGAPSRVVPAGPAGPTRT